MRTKRRNGTSEVAVDCLNQFFVFERECSNFLHVPHGSRNLAGTNLDLFSKNLFNKAVSKQKCQMFLTSFLHENKGGIIIGNL
jgi:hypothetical protein